MKDRVPTYPGRVQMLPVAGQANLYDMTMADEPTEDGTAPIKKNLLTDETATRLNMDLGTATVDRAWWAVMNEINLSRASTFQLLMTGRFP